MTVIIGCNKYTEYDVNIRGKKENIPIIHVKTGEVFCSSDTLHLSVRVIKFEDLSSILIDMIYLVLASHKLGLLICDNDMYINQKAFGIMFLTIKDIHSN